MEYEFQIGRKELFSRSPLSTFRLIASSGNSGGLLISLSRVYSRSYTITFSNYHLLKYFQKSELTFRSTYKSGLCRVEPLAPLARGARQAYQAEQTAGQMSRQF